jgi:hypothetical protein
MRTISFSTLREAVRTRYDLPAFSTSTKPTTAQVNAMINASCSRFSALLCAAYGDDYFTTTATLSTVASTATTALPATFYKLRSLIWLRGADDPVPIHRASLSDYARLSLLTARAWIDDRPVYRFSSGSFVTWLPTPSAVYSVQCTYVATPVDLSADGDTAEVGPGWDEWIVEDVCAKLAQMREEDPSVFISERADTERRIKEQAPDRDESEPSAVRDVSGSRLMSDHQMRDYLTRYG